MFVIIFLFTIIIYPLTTEKGLYLPLVYFMYSSPLLLILLCPSIPKRRELYLWFIIPLLFFSYVIHSERFRISTVLYSVLFILVFILYYRLLNKNSLSIKKYKKIIKLVIYAYFITLVIQQIQFILGLPIFNISWLGYSFKLNSLAYEPSYIATLLPLLMHSIVRIEEAQKGQSLKLGHSIKISPILWSAFLYTVFTCGSSTIFFTFPVFILYFFRNNISIKTLISISFIMIIGIYLIYQFNPSLIERQLNLIPALFSFDIKTLVTVDASASTRIVPFLLLLDKLLHPDINLIFGYGVDFGQELISFAIHEDKDRVTGSLGIVAFVLDYGLLAGILFILSINKLTAKKLLSYENFYFFTCFLVFGFNHYLTWAYILFMSTNLFFEKKMAYKLSPH